MGTKAEEEKRLCRPLYCMSWEQSKGEREDAEKRLLTSWLQKMFFAVTTQG